MSKHNSFDRIRLSEVVLQARSGFASGERSTSGVIQLRMNNVSVEGGLDLTSPTRIPANQKQLKEFSLEEGDVLFNNTNSPQLVGKTAYFAHVDEPVLFSNHFTRLRFDQKRVFPKYAARWLTQMQQSRYFEARCRQWVNQAAFGTESLLALEMPVPQLEEQKRIAAILDKADAIRCKRQEAREVADKFLEATYMDVFGSPVTNPRDWPIEPLGNYLDFLTSGSRGWAQYYVPDGKRFIRSLDVQMNRIGADDTVYVDPPAGTEADRTRVQPQDVLLTITGSCIGRVAFVPPDIEEAYVSQHVAILRLRKELMDRYVSMYLSLDSGGQRQIAKDQYGQTKPGLSLAQIRKFEIPVPPLSEQKRFLAIWDRFTQVQNGMIKADGEVDALFNSLVQRAFKGEL